MFLFLTLGAVIPFGDRELPRATPEEVGFSSERLTRIDDFMERHLAANRMAGAVVLIARRGKVAYFEAFGKQDLKAGKPMAKDVIFRIYSMTKPITSVGVMMLYEEGRFGLNDPISKYVPELKDLEVGVEGTDPKTGEPRFTTVASERDMTIRDLLRHTSGLTYGIFGDSAVDKMYVEAEVLNRDGTMADTVEKLSKLPLKHQPGADWTYGMSTDVLGRFIEVISGMGLDEFFEKRIFGPLGMTDTGFYVPPEKKDRLATLYAPNEDRTIRLSDPETVQDFQVPPTWISGGGGLVSTTADYFRFCQLLLNGGEFEGVRLLGPRTVGLMTRSHTTGIDMGPWLPRFRFGLGFLIYPDPGDVGAIVSEGTHAWGGYASTRFWIDPREEIVGLFMVQILPDRGVPFGERLMVLTYQAIVD